MGTLWDVNGHAQIDKPIQDPFGTQLASSYGQMWYVYGNTHMDTPIQDPYMPNIANPYGHMWYVYGNTHMGTPIKGPSIKTLHFFIFLLSLDLWLFYFLILYKLIQEIWSVNFIFKSLKVCLCVLNFVLNLKFQKVSIFPRIGLLFALQSYRSNKLPCRFVALCSVSQSLLMSQKQSNG